MRKTETETGAGSSETNFEKFLHQLTFTWQARSRGCDNSNSDRFQVDLVAVDGQLYGLQQGAPGGVSHKHIECPRPVGLWGKARYYQIISLRAPLERDTQIVVGVGGRAAGCLKGESHSTVAGDDGGS